MRHLLQFSLEFLFLALFVVTAHGLQNSETQVLLQLRKHLECPSSLEIWRNQEILCNDSSSAQVSITCENNFVSELKIMGDKHVKAKEFNGFAIPNKTLSTNFSVDSFVTTLTRLTHLRVLTLVSLGIWGPLPDKIHRLASLQVLDLSSNFMFGSIPPKISAMVKLQTLKLDGNHFNGTIPDCLGSLSNLSILSMKHNNLTGRFPSALCRMNSLADVVLSQNELFGKIADLTNLTKLRVLDLRENQFDSELPLMPQGLVTVLLSRNLLSGSIPEQLSELDQLQHLDLSYNHLRGTLPSALFSLQNIYYLNLENNMLIGSLPDKLSCGGKLGFVDISHNKLIGKLPSCLVSASDRRVVEYGGNCLSMDSKLQHPESYCTETDTERKKTWEWAIIAIVAAALFVLFLVFGVYFCRNCNLRRNSEQHPPPKIVKPNFPSGISSDLLASSRFITQVVKLGTQTAPICRLFSLQELKEATDNFSKCMLLSEGSVRKVYKGRLENGSYVAIRCLDLPKKYPLQNIKVRLDLLAKLHHPNLVCLMGYCMDVGGQDDSITNRIHLIYEYVPNRNYYEHLSEKCPEKVFRWSDRLSVLIGVAKAVHFLHTGVLPGCFNNELKTNNILIDEHHVAKLSDYGMSIIADEVGKLEAKGQKSSPRIEREDDVYNFGFILLESLVGTAVSGKGETFLLNEMASFGSQDGRRQIVDPAVLLSCSQESLSIAVSITTKCISKDPSHRPSFEDVLWNLQYAAQLQVTADDQRSDSTSCT